MGRIDEQQQEEENSAEEEGAYPTLFEITRSVIRSRKSISCASPRSHSDLAFRRSASDSRRHRSKRSRPAEEAMSHEQQVTALGRGADVRVSSRHERRRPHASTRCVREKIQMCRFNGKSLMVMPPGIKNQ